MEILVSGTYNVFDQGFNGAGVYLISGLYPSSYLTLPIYVGSAQNLRKRYHEHCQHLIGDYHSNGPLQNYYNKYGQESIIFFQLEKTEINNTLDREQFYLKRRVT